MAHEATFSKLESQVRSYCRETPNLFATARGAEIWDANGTRFVDFLSGCGSLNYGHNHPHLKEAIIDYILRDGVANALDFHTEAKLRFMTRFHDVVLKPRNLPYVMHFTGPTGANSVEAAIKLARKCTGRYAVVAFTNAFHGMSMGALSVTGSRASRSSVEAGLQGVIRLPYDGYHGAGVADLERFHQMARDPSGGIDELAAVIVETVQGEGGLNVASIAWLRKLREICTSLGALLIVDDIQAGCGRTGTFFSFERAGIVPDLVCLSKSLSGFGLPMSMLLIDPDRDVWKPGEHNGTFRGSALAFVAAARAVDFWEDPKFQILIGARARTIDAWMKKMLARFPDVLSRLKGLGLMTGFEFFSSEAAQAVAEKVRQRGVLIERCGPHDEVLKLLPPVNIDCDVLEEGLQRMDAAFEDAAPLLSNALQSKAA